MRLLASLALFLLIPCVVWGQDPAETTPGQESTAPPGPDVTIVQGADRMISEYRIHGRLYMIKVTPKKGPPYYLVDTDGDGNLETRRSELTQDMLIPSWTLLEWK